MKLKNKILLASGLVTVLAVGILFFTPYRFLSVTSILVAANVVLLLILHTIFVKRIEKLKKQTTLITHENNFARRVDLTSNDEITSIESSFNVLLNHLECSNHEIEQQVNDKLEEIQKKSQESKPLNIDVANEAILKLGHADHLTSLPNGISFNEILNKAINHANRRQQTLAILILDLDGFKIINKKLGNANGDLVLKEIGRRYESVIRKEDVLSRLEGDRFIVLLNDLRKPKFASMVAEKLLNICTQTLKIDDYEFSLTTSIGVSIYPNDGNSLEQLIENADKALFKAKQSGGNKYQFSTESMHIEALEYIQLESALRKALHNNELALYFQPIYSIKTGTIASVEGLMRWEHPVLGIIDPTKFIQLAEDSGLIIKIGEWALHEAAQRIKYWQDSGYEHVSILLKLSPKQFYYPDIDIIINKALANVNINPKFIELEITEQTAMENVEKTMHIFKKLRNTGVQISIDHFGVGYTSIRYLKQFPINSIKIDKNYIKGIPNNTDDMAIANAIIGLAHSLGLQVIAEGVETAEQVQYLSAQNCDLLQGYFLSHPVSNQKIVLQFKKLQEEIVMV